MRRSNWMRICLILLSALMALSLFACDNTPAETTGTEEPTVTEAENTTVTETEETNAPTETETLSATVPTESETESVPTESETESVPTESETESVPTESETESVPTESETESETVTETEAETEAPVVKHTFDAYVPADEIEIFASSTSAKFGDIALSDDGSYVTLTNKVGANESHFMAYNGAGLDVTGKYLVVKYRTTFENAVFEMFCSTKNAAPAAGDNGRVTVKNSAVVNDGNWQLLVIDLSTFGKTFTPAEDGEYSATYVRFDVYNDPIEETVTTDIAYVALCRDYTLIHDLEADMGSYILWEGAANTVDMP